MAHYLRSLMLACGLTFGVAAVQAQESIVVSSTTSTEQSGLFGALLPKFEARTGIKVKVVAVGTGQALDIGRRGDADALLVHDRVAEDKFVAEGYGSYRKDVMYNDFVIIGPRSDPAKIKGQPAVKALEAIRAAKAPFASRGDDSGTHKLEQGLWKKAAGGAVPDKEPWYIQVGQGMMQTIRLTLERDAYTVTDRGTFIAYETLAKGDPYLAILVEGDKDLLNQYSVVTLNPANCPKAKHDLARKFSDWLAGDRGQKAVAAFKMQGKQLFVIFINGLADFFRNFFE